MVYKNYSLKNYNTFGFDVKTNYFATFENKNELITLLNDFENQPLLILGGGSNVLFTKDFEGLVLQNNVKGFQIIEQSEEYAKVKVGAGENWHTFVLHCIENNWCGIENLSLIPGTVGAAPIQNIGAYGVEIKDFIESVIALDIESKEIHQIDVLDCEFGYRDSLFKNKKKGKYIIIEVVFLFSKIPNLKLEYGDIQNTLKNMKIEAPYSIKNISDAVCYIRQTKLPNPDEIGNAGSFFKNPEIDINLFKKLKEEYPEMPFYASSLPNKIKIPAGWLIEKTGWKGKKYENVGVHEKQALVLVNYGKGNGQEILNLSKQIQNTIKEIFGIDLDTEVNII